MPIQIVMDTNVLVSALRSRRGASFQLLSQVGSGAFEINLSVPLVLEYEEVLTRQADRLGLTPNDVRVVLDYLCRVGRHCEVFYLWRPALSDPDDDMVLELAVAGRCDFIVTHNLVDYTSSERFGVKAATPGAFLRQLEDLP